MTSTSEKKAVMVFDDDPDTLMLCSIILSGKGYNVHTSDNANDIIEKVKKAQPDVILMDNWIPNLGGIKATRLLKGHEEYKSIPVIYFSANNDIKQLAEQAGADTYIAKPFDISHLEKVVADVIVNKVD